MQTKIFSALATILVAIGLATPSVLAETQYLPDVENVVATNVDVGVKLTWDAVVGADKYTLYYGTASIATDGASYENDVALDNVTEYTITDLKPGTTYFFAVAADDSTGKYLGSFNYSEEVSITTPEAAPTVDPVAEAPAVAEPTPTIEPEPAQTEPTVDPAAEELVGKIYPSAKEEPTTPPETLPKSGPEALVFLFTSGAGAYFWRKYRG